ncbi:hypothetical protein F5148DRAFT_1149713 [Russula earlei]|uniref:Uncharacterized protein n=1 Tax=Russula earlei TaxID=71964 RepID=A0ACC0U7P7_9AGAM|nr:hypothetical protein F5148DRAFT_1149713 [Russula earlei]
MADLANYGPRPPLYASLLLYSASPVLARSLSLFYSIFALKSTRFRWANTSSLRPRNTALWALLPPPHLFTSLKAFPHFLWFHRHKRIHHEQIKGVNGIISAASPLAYQGRTFLQDIIHYNTKVTNHCASVKGDLGGHSNISEGMQTGEPEWIERMDWSKTWLLYLSCAPSAFGSTSVVSMAKFDVYSDDLSAF